MPSSNPTGGLTAEKKACEEETESARRETGNLRDSMRRQQEQYDSYKRGFDSKGELSKINYRIHTDAIKQNLIPAEITKEQASIIYANEADVLNVAMFGMSAKQWRVANPDLKGNIRDYASVNELIYLSNMESLNAVFIARIATIRATYQTQSNRHPSDERVGEWR